MPNSKIGAVVLRMPVRKRSPHTADFWMAYKVHPYIVKRIKVSNVRGKRLYLVPGQGQRFVAFDCREYSCHMTKEAAKQVTSGAIKDEISRNLAVIDALRQRQKELLEERGDG